MAPSRRPILVLACLALAFVVWWVAGQYRPQSAPGGQEKSSSSNDMIVWSAEAPAGKFWGNDSGRAIERDGLGVGGKEKALTIRFVRRGWNGFGLNWKGWYPADASDDASKYHSLVFHIRQVTKVPDADFTVQLIDNVKREGDRAPGKAVSLLSSGLPRIDGEWRRVILPLERFARGNELDLKRLWGINFSDSSSREMTFQIDRIGFSNDVSPNSMFPTSASFSATATVALDRPGHAIRDEIYGACELSPKKAAEYGVPIIRWGGNRSSRYNWKVNADNAGKDWFFKNGGRPVKDPADGGWVRFVNNNKTGSYLTVPMLGFVAKDHASYAYSMTKYGKQSLSEPGHPDIGNGQFPDGRPVTGNDWRDTSEEVGPEFIAEGVRLVVKHAGKTDAVRYWALDNEPMLWHETHRDVRPKRLGYHEFWQRTVQYAEAIKKADPGAKIAGFCSWGWTDLFYSAADEGGDGYRTKPDHRAHGNIPLAEWFIKKCGDYKREHGKTLVDVFDFHWYPQAELGGRTPYKGTGMDVKFSELRLRTTRDLWDPTYEPESWVKRSGDGKPTALLRRVRAWIEKHNPAMEICVGEYNFGGGDNITGALAQADVFGIFARERADLAFIWMYPDGTQGLAWQLFRNYDGAGGQFGDRHIPAESSHADLAIYAAKRSKDGKTTIAVVNKNLGGPCSLKIGAAGLKGTMRVWRFDQDTNGMVIELKKEAAEVSGEIKLTTPAASATMLVIE